MSGDFLDHNPHFNAKGVYPAHEELKAINRNTGSAAIIVSFSSQDLLTEYDAMAQLIAKQDEALRVMRDALRLAHHEHIDNIMFKTTQYAIEEALAKANSLIGGE